MIKQLTAERCVRLAALCVLVLIVASAFLAGRGSLPVSSAAGQILPPAPLSSPADGPGLSGKVWISCIPVIVGVFDNRVHVKCAAAVGGVQYFAVPTSEAASAARFLSLWTSAYLGGTSLSILYDPADTSGAPWGCGGAGSADCRRANGSSMP